MPNYDIYYDEYDNTFDTKALLRDLMQHVTTTTCHECGTTFDDVPYNNGAGIAIVSCPNCYRDYPI